MKFGRCSDVMASSDISDSYSEKRIAVESLPLRLNLTSEEIRTVLYDVIVFRVSRF